jgi:pyruvate-formate lyase-activating enzyme
VSVGIRDRDAASPAGSAHVSRTFPSLCDVCLRDATGEVVREGSLVYHRRVCPEHGERRVLMSRNGERYARLDRAYHRMFATDAPVPPTVDACFFITHRCNQKCLYCAMEAGRHPYFEDMHPDAFREEVARYEGGKVSLIGGEPLEHPRFFDFVDIVAASGKTLAVFTNGIRLSDGAVVDRLVARAPRLEVRMTVEGFDEEAFAHLPGRSWRARKLQALAHLDARSVPTVIGHTIPPGMDPGVTRRALSSILRYSMSHDFVRGLTFQSVVALGGSRHLAAGDMLSVDGVLDRVVEALPVDVPREVAYPAQKLMMVVGRLLGLPLCSYVQVLPLVRAGTGWQSLEAYFDISRLDSELDRVFDDLPSTRPGMAAAVLQACLRSARPGRLPALALLAAGVMPIFLREFAFASIPRTVLPLVSISVCDRYNYDANVVRRCEKRVRSSRGGEVRCELCSEMVIRDLRDRVAGDAAGGSDGARRPARR